MAQNWRIKMDNQNEEVLTDREISDLSTYLAGDGMASEQPIPMADNKLSKSDVVYAGEDGEQRVNTGSNSVNLLDYTAWKEKIQDNFPKLVLSAEVGSSLFGQLLINDISNPCALVLIDVPSAGKTITLNLFCDFEKTFALDNFTPASFVSQAANVKAEKLKDVDLLPKIKDKVLIIRDLAPFFGLRDDDLLRSMGVLTRVLDGQGLELHAGVHGKRGYSGDYSFMLLAASTPISPKIFKLMGNLGSRLFFLNLRSEKKSEKELATQLVTTSWKEKEQTCRKATLGFLTALWSKYPEGIGWDKEKDLEDCMLIITRCANLLSKLRGSINVWKEEYGQLDEYSYQEPIIEMPDRISQVLYNLARGHALICGRTNISHDDLGIILNITFDSAPLSRSRLFRVLIENKGEISTDDLMGKINCSRPMALKEMETLKILGLVDLVESGISMVGRPTKIMTLKPEFSWFIGEECKFIQETTQEFYFGNEPKNNLTSKGGENYEKSIQIKG